MISAGLVGHPVDGHHAGHALDLLQQCGIVVGHIELDIINLCSSATSDSF